MVKLADHLREGQWLAISFIGMGMATLAYALSHSIWLAILFISISGLLNAPSFVAGRLIIQRNTTREVRGRVASANFVVRDVIYLIGMGAAGLADIVDVRLLFLINAAILLAAGVLAVVMPGLGQPAAEWRRALALLRSAPVATGLRAGRAATLADFELLLGLMPSLGGLPAKDRAGLAAQSRVVNAPVGTTILRAGETGDCAYFVLSGRAVAGLVTPEGDYRILNPLTPGDFFGEIAALTGAKRTANVVAEEAMTLLEVPAQSLRKLMSLPAFSQQVLSTISERLARTSLIDLPRFAGVDQAAARELREQPAAQAAD